MVTDLGLVTCLAQRTVVIRGTPIQSWNRLRNSNSLFQSQWFLNRVICRDADVAYIIGEHGCFLKTEDGGDHWNRVENAPDVDLRGIALVKNGGFVCGVGGKIYRFIE